MTARSRRLPVFLVAAVAAVLGAAALVSAAPVGPPGGTIYVHDQAYRVVATPRDLPPNGMFDQIYVLGGNLASVADAAPGDPDYNGGRWEVHMVTFNGSPHQFTNAEDLMTAAQSGDVSIGPVVKRFECPLIKGNPNDR
jgi:hypothetical protein